MNQKPSHVRQTTIDARRGLAVEQIGFEQVAGMNAARNPVVFTEKGGSSWVTGWPIADEYMMA